MGELYIWIRYVSWKTERGGDLGYFYMSVEGLRVAVICIIRHFVGVFLSGNVFYSLLCYICTLCLLFIELFFPFLMRWLM